MRTDELIVRLAGSVRPIKRLPAPGIRAVRWVSVAALVMIAAVVLIGPRADLADVLGETVFLGSLVALLLTLLTGAATAFALSVPGAERSPLSRGLPLIAAAAWSAIWILALFASDAPAGPRTAPVHAACAVQIAAGALVTGGLLFAMLARAAPLRPLWASTVASLASMAAGAVVAQVLCPLDDARHLLVGHVFIAFVVAGAGLAVGRRFLDLRPSLRDLRRS